MTTYAIRFLLMLFVVCAANATSVNLISWDSCGSGEHASIKTFSVSPNPFDLPGAVTIDFDGTSTIDAVAPLDIKLTIKRKVTFFWLEIPCVDNIGSCDYEDACIMLENYFPGDCPPIFGIFNIPCHCPITKGNYNIPSISVNTPPDPLPPILSDGEYKINAQVKTNGVPFACVDLHVKISSPSVVVIQ